MNSTSIYTLVEKLLHVIVTEWNNGEFILFLDSLPNTEWEGMYLTANMLHYILVHVDVVQHALQLLHVVHSTCSSFVTVTVVTQIMKRCTHQGASLRTLYSDLLPGLPGTRTYMQYINSSSSDQLAQNLITMHFPSLNLFSHTFLHMTIFPIYLPDYEKNLSLQQIAIHCELPELNSANCVN